MIADVAGPRLDLIVEPLLIASKERSQRFLVAWSISGHGGHETISRLTRLTDSVGTFVGASRDLDKLAERD
jgi:hypothetical protein